MKEKTDVTIEGDLIQFDKETKNHIKYEDVMIGEKCPEKDILKTFGVYVKYCMPFFDMVNGNSAFHIKKEPEPKKQRPVECEIVEDDKLLE
jgi:hypothetical protein